MTKVKEDVAFLRGLKEGEEKRQQVQVVKFDRNQKIIMVGLGIIGTLIVILDVIGVY